MIGPDSITIPYLLMVLVLLPLAGTRSYFRLKSGKPLPPKSRRYTAMISGQVLLIACSFLVARKNDLDLLGKVPGVWVFVGSGLYLGLIALRMQRGWKKLSAERSQRARVLLPENLTEMRYWVPISLLAGLSEECAFRGMAYIGLREVAGSATLSMVVCVLAFGIAHMMQGWRGVLGTAVIALLLHGIVYLTQGLYLAIAVHAAYDLVVGAIAVRHVRQDEMAATQAAQSASSGG
jgi:membrane protease YdiL (CAAX protease family)